MMLHILPLRLSGVRNLEILTLPLTSLVHDKTLLERQQRHTCYLELKRYSVGGEKDLTIFYINGTPNVTSRLKNSGKNLQHPPTSPLRRLFLAFSDFSKTVAVFEQNLLIFLVTRPVSTLHL